MTTYFDASVIVPMLALETATVAALNFASSIAGRAVVSEFAAGEVASALARLVRTRALARRDAEGHLEALDAWRAMSTVNVAVGDDDIVAAARLVRRFDLKLRLPDAVHLAVCVRHGFALATFDRRLATAGRLIGATVVVPGQADTVFSAAPPGQTEQDPSS